VVLLALLFLQYHAFRFVQALFLLLLLLLFSMIPFRLFFQALFAVTIYQSTSSTIFSLHSSTLSTATSYARKYGVLLVHHFWQHTHSHLRFERLFWLFVCFLLRYIARDMSSALAFSALGQVSRMVGWLIWLCIGLTGLCLRLITFQVCKCTFMLLYGRLLQQSCMFFSFLLWWYLAFFSVTFCLMYSFDGSYHSTMAACTFEDWLYFVGQVFLWASNDGLACLVLLLCWSFLY